MSVSGVHIIAGKLVTHGSVWGTKTKLRACGSLDIRQQFQYILPTNYECTFCIFGLWRVALVSLSVVLAMFVDRDFPVEFWGLWLGAQKESRLFGLKTSLQREHQAQRLI